MSRRATASLRSDWQSSCQDDESGCATSRFVVRAFAVRKLQTGPSRTRSRRSSGRSRRTWTASSSRAPLVAVAGASHRDGRSCTSTVVAHRTSAGPRALSARAPSVVARQAAGLHAQSRVTTDVALRRTSVRLPLSGNTACRARTPQRLHARWQTVAVHAATRHSVHAPVT